jgi:hypothetical protein
MGSGNGYLIHDDALDGAYGAECLHLCSLAPCSLPTCTPLDPSSQLFAHRPTRRNTCIAVVTHTRVGPPTLPVLKADITLLNTSIVCGRICTCSMGA